MVIGGSGGAEGGREETRILAKERTALAKERNSLAYIRTGLAFGGISLILIKLYDVREPWIHAMGVLTTTLGLGMVLYGFYHLVVSRREEEAIEEELEGEERIIGRP